MEENIPLINTNIKLICTKTLLVFIGLVLVLFSGLKAADAATLYFSPSSGNQAQDQNFTVSVLLNSEQAANAIHGVVTFPTEYISAISVNYNDSIVDLWVRKPSFSNFGTVGNVIFEGAILNPGFTGSGGKIVNIIFRVKKQGLANVDMTDFAILANDGLGTNIAVAGDNANFVFTKPLPYGENRSIEEKINTIEEKVKKIEKQNKLFPLVQESNFYQRVDNLWIILPLWIKFVAIILVVAAATFSLFVLGLIVVIIIWIWNRIRYKRPYIKFQLKRSIGAIKLLIRKLWAFIGMAEREIKSDITYSYQQTITNLKAVEKQVSFKTVLNNYVAVVWRIIRRFFEINNKKEENIFENETNNKVPENKEDTSLNGEDKNNYLN